ncbi:MAG: putative sensor domain DACNV-containing protein [Syntrophobacteraceae bacterium]|jgi:hypothetical protein
MKHFYPEDLASILKQQWDTSPAFMDGERPGDGCVSDPLPEPSVLEFLISTCYQASLMVEEGRPVTFRLLFIEPNCLKAKEGPPAGLHRITFSESRPFNENELRRLSPAADFYRSLIGVNLDPTEGLRVWGLINSGPRWIQAVHGGRKTTGSLPPSLAIQVTGPGRLAICKGGATISTLKSGLIACPKEDISVSGCLQASFAPSDNSLFRLHKEARECEGKSWAILDEALIKILTQQVYRRIVSVMRNFHHGGTLILVPPEKAAELASENRYIDIKYKFTEEEPRHRLGTLYLQLMNTLAEECGKRGIFHCPVGWNEYVASDSVAIERLDEAIFEAAHFIADLTTVDGAVVMTKSLELLGFGGEILGRSSKIETVARVLDAEGEQRQVESTLGVGTRHRSAYRLCRELHDVVAIVVSQDGAARIIVWKDDMVVYWDQVTLSVLDFGK